MFVENLVQLGLSEREAMLYLLLLQIGPSQVSSLAKRARMKRVSVYSVLASLEARGLVTFEQAPVGRRYVAHDPECLLYFLEQENAELKCRMDLARECIRKLSTERVLQSPILG